jgi:hypothetical protein
MRIELHIERLVLDGCAANSVDGEAVRVALGAELTRLLQAAPPQTQSVALSSLRTTAVSAIAAQQPATLGSSVARVLHAALGSSRQSASITTGRVSR